MYPVLFQCEMLKCFQTIFCIVEACHRSVKLGGYEKNRMFCADNSYVDMNNLWKMENVILYGKCSNVKVDAETAAR